MAHDGTPVGRPTLEGVVAHILEGGESNFDFIIAAAGAGELLKLPEGEQLGGATREDGLMMRNALGAILQPGIASRLSREARQRVFEMTAAFIGSCRR